MSDPDPAVRAETAASASPRKPRPKPGERRIEILQALAVLLQEPDADRVTTAAIARRLQVSEAALYRHFASKAQMFEGLIAFIESSLFSLINRITTEEQNGKAQIKAIVQMLLAFAEKNPGMTRVLVGDALTVEDNRLQARVNTIIGRLQMVTKQSCRVAIAQGQISSELEPVDLAVVLISYVQGRWLRYAKSGFGASPTAGAGVQLDWILR